MTKKKKILKTPAAKAAFENSEEKVRNFFVSVVSGESPLLKDDDKLFDAFLQNLDFVNEFSDKKLQLEFLAWALRADFLIGNAESEEIADDWRGLLWDVCDNFIVLAKKYDDKKFIADLLHDLAMRFTGEEPRTQLFYAVNIFLPTNVTKALVDELLNEVEDLEQSNKDDVCEAIVIFAHECNDLTSYIKAIFLKDPEKSNDSILDIANECFEAGKIELAKQWLGDVKNPGAEDEEAFMDLQAAIACKENRMSDCIKIARSMYEKFPKATTLSRLIEFLPDSEAEAMLKEHATFRNGDCADYFFMRLLANNKCYKLLDEYVTKHEKDLTIIDAYSLKKFADTLDKDGQTNIAAHIRDWIVEEPKELTPFCN